MSRYRSVGLAAVSLLVVVLAGVPGCHGGEVAGGASSAVSPSAIAPHAASFQGGRNGADTSDVAALGVATCAGALLGDLDGDGSPGVGDAIAILRIVVGLSPANPLADCDATGDTTVSDAIIVLRCVVGLELWPVRELFGPRIVAVVVPEEPVRGVFDITVQALAQDANETMVRIDCTFNGTTQSIDGGEGTVGFDTGSLAGGTIQQLTVVAFDSYGLTATQTYDITVAGIPPTVSITAPADGANVEGAFDVNVTGRAQEPGATLAKIDVTFGGHTQMIDGAGTADLVGTVQFDSLVDLAAIAAVGPAVVNGQYYVTAVATDSLGTTGQAQIIVAVNNYLLHPENVTALAGQSVRVPILLTDTTNVTGFSMTIVWDASCLTGVSVELGSAVPPGALLLRTWYPGALTVAVAGTTPFSAWDEEILALTFTAGTTTGDTAIWIDPAGATPLAFADRDFEPIWPLPALAPGTVTIQ